MGSTSSTGASVPLATIAPDFISFCQTYAPSFAPASRRAAQHIGRVGRAVNPLHRGDDAERAEARDVGGAEMLRVLDAPAQVLLVGLALKTSSKMFERLAIGAVADGVDAELDSRAAIASSAVLRCRRTFVVFRPELSGLSA